MGTGQILLHACLMAFLKFMFIMLCAQADGHAVLHQAQALQTQGAQLVRGDTDDPPNILAAGQGACDAKPFDHKQASTLTYHAIFSWECRPPHCS
jgi:hypothetical protein